MGFYNYFTINAYNLYGLLGLNWRSLEEFPAWVSPTLTAASALLAVVLSGIIYWKSKHEHAIFAVPVVIISTIYLFAPKMHERYLFPALFFLLACAVFTRDLRLYLTFFGLSTLHFLNVAYVLYLNNSYVPPTSPVLLTLSAAHLILYVYLLYVIWNVFVQEQTITLDQENTYEPPRHLLEDSVTMEDRRMKAKDWVLAILIAAVYACVGFWCLGSSVMPETTWAPASGESVTLSLSDEGRTLRYLPGLTVPSRVPMPIWVWTLPWRFPKTDCIGKAPAFSPTAACLPGRNLPFRKNPLAAADGGCRHAGA